MGMSTKEVAELVFLLLFTLLYPLFPLYLILINKLYAFLSYSIPYTLLIIYYVYKVNKAPKKEKGEIVFKDDEGQEYDDEPTDS